MYYKKRIDYSWGVDRMVDEPIATKSSNGHRYRSQYDEVYNFMLGLERDPKHALHVANLSIQLFDNLHPLHNLGQKEKQLLNFASLLHDIGWSIAGKKHHKHSMRLILSHNFQSLSFWEQSMVAQIARYHRKAMPKQSHNKFSQLDDEDQKIVCYLASILRIADALDRNKQSLIQQIHCEWDDKVCHIFVDCDSDMKAEINALNKKKDLFLKIFKLDVAFVQPTDQTIQQGLYLCSG